MSEFFSLNKCTGENYAQTTYGVATNVAANIQRVIAQNPKPLTYRGTNTYIVGSERLAIIDPGPKNIEHIDAVLSVLNGRKLEAIFVTHTHVDHSGAAFALSEKTGAIVYGHSPLPRLEPNDVVEADYDFDFIPQERLQDGACVDLGEFVVEAVHTPGHFPNHLCFALKGTGLLFSGDHVLGWASTVIAPPIGDMGDYIASLEKLALRPDALYMPGHGPAIEEPKAVLKHLIKHRKERERQVHDCLLSGMHKIEDIVRKLYQGLDAGLFVPACKSVEAHILHLEAQGLLRQAAHG